MHKPLTAEETAKVDAEIDAAWARVGSYSSEQRAKLETGKKPKPPGPAPQ